MRFKGVAARCSRRLEWQSLRPFNKSRRSRRRRTMRIVPRRPVDASNPCHCWRYYIVVLKMSQDDRDLPPGAAWPPRPRHTVRAERGHSIRPELADRPRPPGSRGAVRWGLPAGQQRDDDVGVGPAVGLQATADDREAVLAAEDRLRGGAGVPEGGEPDPGVALRVLPGVADGVAAGA